MNTKRFLFAIATLLILIAAACTPNVAEDDQLYENSLDKSKAIKKI